MVSGYVDSASVRLDASENVSVVLKKVQASISQTLARAVSIGPALTAAFSGVNRSIAAVGQSMTNLGRSMQGVGTQLTVFGAIGVGLFGKAVNSSADYQESLNRFRALFGDQTAAAEAFAEALAKSVRRSKSEIVSGLSDFQGFATGLGLTGEAARELAQEMTALAVDFGSFNNISTDDSIIKFLAALSGEAMPVKRFGIDISETALKLRGLDDSASQMEKGMERLKIIRETMGRQGAIGDAERTAFSATNSFRALGSTILDLSIAVGSTIEKPLTDFANLLAKATTDATAWATANPKLVASVAAVTAGVLAAGVGMLGLGLTLSIVGTAISGISGLLSAVVVPFAALRFITVAATGALSGFAKLGVSAVMVSLHGLTAALGVVQVAMRAAFLGSGLLTSLAAAAVKGVAAFGSAFSSAFIARIPIMLTSFAILGAQMQIAAGAMAAKVAISFTAGFAALMLAKMQIVVGSMLSVFATGFMVPLLAMGSAIALQMQITMGGMAAKIAATLVTSILPVLAMIAANVQIVLGGMAAKIATVLSSIVVQSMAAALTPLVGVVATAAGAMTSVVMTIFGSMFAGILASSIAVISAIGAALGSTILAALSPILGIIAAIGAKVLILTAIAGALVAVFYQFKSQISSVFSAIGKSVSSFASGAAAEVGSFLAAAKDVFFDIVDFAQGQFTSLLAIGKSTFSGLSSAMQAGDFKLAFQIAMAGAKEAFFSFAFDAVTKWEDAIVGFVSGLIELKFWFQKTFTEITGFVKTAFDTMETYRQSAVNSISRGIVEGLVAAGAVDKEVLTTLEEDIARQETSKAAAIKTETDNQVAKLETEKTTALGSVDAGVKKFKDGLGEALGSAREASQKLQIEAAAAALKNGLAEGLAVQPPVMPDISSSVNGGIGSQMSDTKTNIETLLSGISLRSAESISAFVKAANPSGDIHERQTRAFESIAKSLAEQPGKIGDEFAEKLAGVGTVSPYRT